MDNNDELYLTCPICSIGTLLAVQNHLAIDGGIPIWYGECDNQNCIGSEGGEVMGDGQNRFPLIEWAEEFGVYIDGDS